MHELITDNKDSLYVTCDRKTFFSIHACLKFTFAYNRANRRVFVYVSVYFKSKRCILQRRRAQIQSALGTVSKSLFNSILAAFICPSKSDASEV